MRVLPSCCASGEMTDEPEALAPCAAGGDATADPAPADYEGAVRYVASEPALLYALAKDPPEGMKVEAWARALTLTGLHHGQLLCYLRLLMGYEVGRRPGALRTTGCAGLAKEFLRGSSLLSKSLDVFTQTVLPEFIAGASGAVVRRVLALGQKEEEEEEATEEDAGWVLNFDVCDGATEADTLRSSAVVVDLVEAFLTALEVQARSAPPLLKAICREIHVLAREIGGDAVAMTSAFAMLRCLSPSLVDPARYGVLDAGERLSDTALRNLLTVSRVLQRLANGSTFASFEGAAYRELDARLARLRVRYCAVMESLGAEPLPEGALLAVAQFPVGEPAASCHMLHELFAKGWSRLHAAMAHLCPYVDSHAILREVQLRLPQLPQQYRADGGGGGGFLPSLPAGYEDDPEYTELLYAAWTAPEPLETQRWLRVAGMTSERAVVVQLFPARMPLGDAGAREAMVQTFAHLLDGIARGPYVLVMLNEGGNGRQAFSWLKALYEETLPYYFDEHLEALHVLHADMWTKAALWLPRGDALPDVQLRTSVKAMLESIQIDPSHFPVTAALLKNERAAAGPDAGAPADAGDYPALPSRCIQWLKANARHWSGDLFQGVPDAATGRARPVPNGMVEDLGVRSAGDVWEALLRWVHQQREGGGVFGAAAAGVAAAGATLAAGGGFTGAEAAVTAALAALPAAMAAFLEDFFGLLRGAALEGDPVNSPGALAGRLAHSLFPDSPPAGGTAAIQYLIVQPPPFWQRLHLARTTHPAGTR
eukprot:TRINITY_DN3162_c0_g1_i1.p1 TRINITY_DN3162_c0_g1~~TRINITY_DN3162_c0_g1_i1.p1  ORF type:complete len:767 (+),score=200.44 TRINITY_DN3162_c0_g1_i1:83-2383(+)